MQIKRKFIINSILMCIFRIVVSWSILQFFLLNPLAHLLVNSSSSVKFWLPIFCYLFFRFKKKRNLISGLQTLGEEYLSLLQISDVENRLIPSLWRRLYFIFLHIFVPFLIDKSLRQLHRHIIHSDTHSFLGVRLTRNRKARRTFVQIIDWLRWEHDFFFYILLIFRIEFQRQLLKLFSRYKVASTIQIWGDWM